MEYGKISIDDVCGYFEFDQKESSFIRSRFSSERCDLFEVCKFIEKYMPSVCCPYDIVSDHQKKYLESIKIDYLCVTNNLPCDISEQEYLPLIKSIETIGGESVNKTINVDQIINIVFDFFIGKHNEVVTAYNNLKKEKGID